MDSGDGDRYPSWYISQFYKKVHSSLYEKFTEACFYFNGKGVTKKQAHETLNANWIKFSLEEKKSIVKKRKPQTLLSFGFTKNISRPSNASDSSYEPPRDVPPLEASSIPPVPATNMLVTMNTPEAVTNKNKYISSQEVSLNDIFRHKKSL